jgi:uncharacterized protein
LSSIDPGDSAEVKVVVWKLLLIGLAAGVVGGGLGVGGGIVLVPLLLAVGLGRHRAHATSLAGIVLIALAGAISFGASDELQLGLGLVVGIGGIVGSVLGASAMHRMSSRNLSIVFGLILLVAGGRMLYGGNPLPVSSDMSNAVRFIIAIGIGLVAGLFSGVAGIGGGVVIVPATIFFLGLAQHEAQGTSLVAIVLSSAAGTVVNFRNHRVRLAQALVVGSGGVVGSLFGSRLALGAADRTLAVIFGLLMLYIGLRTLYRAYRPEPATA